MEIKFIDQKIHSFNVYNSVAFSIPQSLQSSLSNPRTFRHPQINPGLPSSHSPNPCTYSWQSLTYFWSLQTGLLWTLHMNKITKYVSFWNWLTFTQYNALRIHPSCCMYWYSLFLFITLPISWKKFLLEYSWFAVLCFCCTAKWLSYTYIYVHSFLDSFPI